MSNTYQQEKDRIIALFNVEPLAVRLETEQKKVMTKVLAIMKDSSPEALIEQSVPTARPEIETLLSGEEFAPEAFSVNDHFCGIQSFLNKRYMQIKEEFQAYREYATNQERDFQGFDIEIDIAAEVELLNSQFPWNEELQGWALPHYVLQDGEVEVDFPGLVVSLDFTKERVTQALRIKHSPDNERIYDGYPHPHVDSNGKICMGDGEATCQLYWEGKKIFSLLFFVNEILGTYNPSSPYADLKRFRGKEMFTCENCGEVVDEDHVMFIGGDHDIPSCEACSIFVDHQYQWRDEYVGSGYENKYIKKENATRAFVDEHRTDYVENILGNSDFCACPECHMFIRTNLVKDIDTKRGICPMCYDRIEAKLRSEESEAA